MTNRIRRRAVVVAITTVIMVLLTGCATSTPPANGSAPAAGPAGASTITISDFAFGAELAVAPGATVTVVNKDSAPHNVTATDGSFRTANLKQDESTTFTAPNTPGRYAFTCTVHPQMKGALVVGTGSTTPADPGGGGGGGY